MKKLTLFLLVSLCAPAALAVGVGSGPVSPVDRYIAQISERLGLTEDQRERIRPVLAANAVAKMAKLSQQNDANSGEEGKDINAGHVQGNELTQGGQGDSSVSAPQEELADILTPAQLAEYEKMKREDMARTRELVRSRRY